MKGLLIMPVSYSKTAVFHNLFTVGEGRAYEVGIIEHVGAKYCGTHSQQV